MQESLAQLARHQPGKTGYFTFVYQPIFDKAGHITDIMCVCVNVTEQVRARQQVQDLNEELAAKYSNWGGLVEADSELR